MVTEVRLMDNAFLSYACDVLADTGKGLTGSEIVKYCNRFAIDYNVRIPVDDVKMLQMNHKPQIPNKRTALKMNLETFELQQQIEIIRFLSELPKLKDNEDIKELINKYHTGKAGGFITALKWHFTSTPLKRYRRS